MKAMVMGLMVVGACISPVIPIGSGKSAHQIEHEKLDQQVPVMLTSLHHAKGPPRKAKIRVWADDEYRAQNVHWQHGFEEQLDYANQVLIPMLGVMVEPEYRTWDRHAPGSTLEEALHELEGVDRGEDAVWILGLTSSLTLASGTFEQLGVANLGERHLVVRGHADLEERKAFARAYPDLDAAQREQVLEARRRHKTTAVLLHEMAHSLGALHETTPDWLMYPGYSHRAATISDRNRELMLIVVEDRLKPAAERDARTTARRLLAALEPEWGGWSAEDRGQLMARLQGQVGTAESASVAGAVPAAIRDQLRRVEELMASKDVAGAQAALEPLLAAYPAQAELRILDCQIELGRSGAKSARAVATCERAAALSTDVMVAISVAAARLDAGDAKGARQTLVLAEDRATGLAGDKAPAVWLRLAEAYHQMGALTWAEAAVAKADAKAGVAKGIVAWATMTRVRYGVPRDGRRWKLAQEDEAAAVNAVREAVGMVNGGKFDAAAKAVAAAERRWPALPGLLAARCDLEFRRGAVDAARGLCRRAAANRGSSWALYLGGIVELRAASAAGDAAGTRLLREAIELDPELSQAWRALGKALKRANATAEHEQLEAAYQARFGSKLER